MFDYCKKGLDFFLIDDFGRFVFYYVVVCVLLEVFEVIIICVIEFY